MKINKIKIKKSHIAGWLLGSSMMGFVVGEYIMSVMNLLAGLILVVISFNEEVFKK